MGKFTGDPNNGVPLFYSSVELDTPLQGRYFGTCITLVVDFKISMYATSGLSIDSVSLQNESYTPFKGGRSFTESGTYQIRYAP